MATTRFRVLFLGCVAFSLVEKVASDLKISVPQCCELGINWHKDGLKCHNDTRPVLNVPESEQELCLKTMQLCCEKSYRQRQCRFGIRKFKTEKKCLPEPESYLDGVEAKCCASCRLGAELGELEVPCSSINIPVEEEFREAILSCCADVSGLSKISKPFRKLKNNQSDILNPIFEKDNFDDFQISTSPSDNLCDLLPGQLCAHICVPTQGSYYCKCEEGYVLMEDQKTCQKNSSQTVKPKPGIAVSPRVIIPNPEKPVPLYKKPTWHDVGTTPAVVPLMASWKKTCKDYNDCEHRCIDTESGFRCVCRDGFALDADKKSCSDVDECLKHIDNCDLLTEKCVNEVGTYRCEKVEKPALQSVSTAFTKTYGKTTTSSPPPLAVVPKEVATGACPTGFEDIFGSCTDVDECDSSRFSEVCDSDHDCINTPGSYACRCKPGFQENPETLECFDINECQLSIHNCMTSERCDNTIGSFRCVRYTGCGTGYTLNSQTGQCEDDDECKLKTDNCRFLGPNYICRNTLGSFRCERKRCLPGDSTCDPEKQCPPGYVQGESGNCVDLDECTTGSHNCHPFADVCVNRVGSFECRKVIFCPKGYEATAKGCVDVNECTTKDHKCKGLAECRNEKGSYSCVCPTGYLLAPDNSCEDINECNFYLCPYNSKCINTPGSYRCECNIGFKNINENTCHDIDECSITPGICQHNCINVFGSYRCTCKPGFKLHENNRSCTDLNECEIFKDQRLCIGECVNIPGSFSCRCPPGYILGPDGRSCQDVDECLRNPCRGEDDICLNTRGSYRCNAIRCPPDYVKDTEHKNRCKRMQTYCREDDVNCLQRPMTYSYNFLTFVSKLPIPPIGHLDLFTMRGPHWAGTDSQFTLDMLSARAAQGVQPATKETFQLRNSGWNQGVISLVRPIPGPQEIELQLTMKIYHSGVFVGSGVAKLLIHVSEFEY